MSQIKQLKENPDFNINLIKLLEILYPDSKTKYYEMFSRIIKNEICSSGKYKIEDNREIDIVFSLLLKSFLKERTKDEKMFEKFITYNEKNQIQKNDLSGYRTFDEIKSEVKKADDEEEIRKLETEIIKLFVNDEWMVVKPLTHKSSVKYGFNTKWCTAMQDRSSYFNDYTRDGILIYCINKKNNNKSVAVYKKLKQSLTFWTSTDNQIDSIEANFPHEITDIIRKEINSNESNLTVKQNKDKKELTQTTVKKNALDALQASGLFSSSGSGTNDTFRKALELIQRYSNN